MIGDIFIGLLLIFSAAINLLAIGSFWVTPSLRTTTNRFVANLLIVNFLSCLVLSPAAFSPAITSSSTVDIAAASASSNKSEKISDVNSTTLNNASTASTLFPSPFDDDVSSVQKIENILERYQSCSLDFVVAVSVLSMLLVVMDTFIAVTDPLRYHSRISDLKAWLLIGLCWIIGISFGIASALQSSTEIISLDTNQIISGGFVYNTMFLLTYFLSIILTPFLLLILMYWRIFTEARENGQRMRQNGSSPLLQSALNLATSAATNQQQNNHNHHHPHQQQQQQSQQVNSLPSPQCLLLVTSPSTQSCKQLDLNKQQNADNNIQQTSSSSPSDDDENEKIIVKSEHTTTKAIDGLTMRIDKQEDYYGVNNNNNSNQQINFNDNYHQFPFVSNITTRTEKSGGGAAAAVTACAYNETKTFLLSSPPHELLPILIEETEIVVMPANASRQHQNILLTLTTACEAAATTVKRNQSAKQLLSDPNFFASHDDERLLELRQVHSSPNLQNTFESPTKERMSQQETLELPSVQASPKTLRYMNSLRHRLSNASSLFKYREEGRAARISILVVIMFLLTYFPYGLLSLIHGQNSIIKESSLSFLSILFVLLANLCSPFIFAYRNKRVRKGVQRLLGIDKKTNERLEKFNSLKRSCSTRIKNYRQNQLHKSFNFGSNRPEGNKHQRNHNIRRSQTFTACKYLTPPDANAKTTSISNDEFTSAYQQQYKTSPSINIKEKKSILKIVRDSSKKFSGRLGTTHNNNNINDNINCQNIIGGQLETTMIGVDVISNNFTQQTTTTKPVEV